jgi:hypothetical protein
VYLSRQVDIYPRMGPGEYRQRENSGIQISQTRVCCEREKEKEAEVEALDRSL